MNDKLYGIYNGDVYRIKPDINGKVFLLPDTEDGSVDIIHAKIVNNSDITEAYRLNLYAEYKGVKVDIAREAGEEYELWADDYATAQELGFNRCDKYGYNLMVKKSDVNVISEKTPFEFS